MKSDASAMKAADDERLARLIRSTRWAAMATVDAVDPYVSWVAYAPEENLSSLYLHLSHLAKHTRNLLENGKIAVAISEPDSGEGDPQQLARLILQGHIEVIGCDNELYPAAKARYLGRFPDALMRFGFADFALFRFVVEKGRYVEGFASSHKITTKRLERVARLA